MSTPKNLPQDYLDDTFGIRPAPKQESFNNIIFLLEYLLAIDFQGKKQPIHKEWWKKHWELNLDENGLYKPKNSRDNLYAKIMGDQYLLGRSQLSLNECLKHINRVTDVVLWTLILGGFWAKLAVIPLIPLMLVEVVYSIAKEGKVRPKIHERILWTLQGKKYNLTRTINDGKILYIMSLWALSGKYRLFYYLEKLCSSILKKRYGENYFAEMLKVYFKDKDHPIIKEWEKIKETLDKYKEIK